MINDNKSNNSINNSKDIEKELTRIFDRFNHHFFNDELPEVIITFKPTRGALGHMTSWRAWGSDTAEDKYELNISAFDLDRSPKEICETLLHEQVHLYNIIHRIKDCSNKGRYHNLNYKRTAEQHGLICEKLDYYGWALTSFNDEALAYFKRLNVKKFSYYYKDDISKKKLLLRYVCPKCEKTKAWLSSEQYIICGKCMCPMRYTPTEKLYIKRKSGPI